MACGAVKAAAAAVRNLRSFSSAVVSRQRESWQAFSESGRVAVDGVGVMSGGVLRALCRQGRIKEALRAAEFMEQRGVYISTHFLYALLKGCIARKDLEVGRGVHSLVCRAGFGSNVFIGTHLIRMFISCGSLVEANQVFHSLSAPDVYMWSQIISAHTKNGQAEEGIRLYKQVLESGVQPDEHVFAAVIKACATAGALTEGSLIHAHALESGLACDVFVGTNLIDMYCRCHSLEDARRVFDGLEGRNRVSWNAMISGYVLHGRGEEAVQVYEHMQEEGVNPSKVTFLSVLKAGMLTRDLAQGRKIHGHITKFGCDEDVFVGSSLIEMYAKCGSLEDACSVFSRLSARNLVSWNAMFAGYMQYGEDQKSLQLFQELIQEGLRPDETTFLCVLTACTSLANLKEGKRIHARIVQYRFESNINVSNALIHMYAKCGSMEDARRVFDQLVHEDQGTWDAMLAAYSQQGDSQESLKLVKQMQDERPEPDEVTLSSISRPVPS